MSSTVSILSHHMSEHPRHSSLVMQTQTLSDTRESADQAKTYPLDSQNSGQVDRLNIEESCTAFVQEHSNTSNGSSNTSDSQVVNHHTPWLGGDLATNSTMNESLQSNFHSLNLNASLGDGPTGYNGTHELINNSSASSLQLQANGEQSSKNHVQPKSLQVDQQVFSSHSLPETRVIYDDIRMKDTTVPLSVMSDTNQPIENCVSNSSTKLVSTQISNQDDPVSDATIHHKSKITNSIGNNTESTNNASTTVTAAATSNINPGKQKPEMTDTEAKQKVNENSMAQPRSGLLSSVASAITSQTDQSTDPTILSAAPTFQVSLTGAAISDGNMPWNITAWANQPHGQSHAVSPVTGNSWVNSDNASASTWDALSMHTPTADLQNTAYDDFQVPLCTGQTDVINPNVHLRSHQSILVPGQHWIHPLIPAQIAPYHPSEAGMHDTLSHHPHHQESPNLPLSHPHSDHIIPAPFIQLPQQQLTHSHQNIALEDTTYESVFTLSIADDNQAQHNSRDGRRRAGNGRSSVGSSGGAGHTSGNGRRPSNGLHTTFRRLNLDTSTRLRDLTGRIVELSADQHGSRMIQHCIELATPAEMHKVLEEIDEQIYQVMTDVFGNYVIQKLLQYGDGTVQHAIVHGMQGRVPALSMHNYGCRVIQEVLATVTSADLRNIVLHELESYNVSDLIMDQHANHVIQKCVTSLSTDNLGFVIFACERQASAMSRHLYGCRVIQRLIEQCTPEQLSAVYANVLGDCASLMKNAYGNYVIQHVLDHGEQTHRDAVMGCVAGNLLPLSQHKFASNVIEKFLRVARPDQIAELVAELCHSTLLPDGTTAAPLHIMMKDKYANYVIQTLMQFSPRQTQTALLDYIYANREVLRGYNYGKHIVAKAEALRSQN